jgi:hypothetical protein
LPRDEAVAQVHRNRGTRTGYSSYCRICKKENDFRHRYGISTDEYLSQY